MRNARITNVLLLNASFINNLGLMHGKMGIAIYFFHLARETQNNIYEEYAGELIDEIYEEITAETPCNFANGLAGIGWGIEYLVQNGFIEADTDEVLEEFDNRLFQQLIYHTPQGNGLLNGLTGLGAYFLQRLKNPNSNDENIKTLTNKQTLIHLIDELDRTIDDKQARKLSNFQAQNQEPETFDITRDYPLLLWFLAELHEQNIFNFKVDKIINRLLAPLADENNWPQLHSNRLLLVFSLQKLSGLPHFKATSLNEREEHTLIERLLAGLNRETIKSELEPDNVTIKHGTTGIAWIYSQLFEQTNNNHYLNEAQYWNDQSFAGEETDRGLAGFELKNEACSFGLLEGLAGIGLLSSFCFQFDNLTVKP